MSEYHSLYLSACSLMLTLIAALCVVGNKIDLPKELRAVSTERGKDFARSLNALFAETSAAHDIGMWVCVCLCMCICLSVLCVHMRAHVCIWSSFKHLNSAYLRV